MTLANEMKVGNCLIFAVRKFWKAGGYLIIRKSRYTWLPHIMWTRNIAGIEIEEFKPTKRISSRLARAFPIHTVVFRGRVRVGMGEERADK